MKGNSSHQATYLSAGLDQLTVNPRLAQLLPADLAHRFHALPVAEDNGRITVVMADPDDPEAREAVVGVLGPESCLVQGDCAAIDALLAVVWEEMVGPPLRLLVCTWPAAGADPVWTYARSMAELLNTEVNHLETLAGMDALAGEGASIEHDLVILKEPDHPLVAALLTQQDRNAPSPLKGISVASRRRAVPLGVLVAQRPRWPLERILLIVCGEGKDDATVDWALRLAKPSGSTVTVLAVVPSMSAMYDQRARVDHGLAALLSADTPLGRQLRQVACQLVDREITGSLRLRQGPPDWQICHEVTEGDYDLVITSPQLCEGSPVGDLLHWTDRPILITPVPVSSSGSTGHRGS